MNNLNFYQEKLPKTYSSLENICSTNCQAQIKSLIWINQQPFWAYHCSCCNTYSFERGKTSNGWGEIYD